MLTFPSLLRRLFGSHITNRARRNRATKAPRLGFLVLEDRCLPSASTLQAAYGHLPLTFEAN
jgi:hypothetical protein